MFERDSLTTGTGNAIPPDLLPDYTEGHIYEDAPEPNPDWRPPKPQKPNLQNKPPLPDRPQGSLRPVQKQRSCVVQESSTSEETYTYVSDRMLSGFESGYNSASGSGSSFVSEKTVNEIQDLLKLLNLSRFCDVFQSNLVDGNLLEELNEEALRADFGFMYVEAIKLMKYVRTGHIPR